MMEEDREILVVDASAIGWLLTSGSPATQVFEQRLHGAALVAPAHLPIEVDSLLRSLERGGRITAGEAGAARDVFAGFSIELWEWVTVADRAWELRANLTTYDAGYAALAEQLGAVLITCDARLARASGARCAIEVLGH